MHALQFFFIRYWSDLSFSGPISIGLTAVLIILMIAAFAATFLRKIELAGRLLQFAFAVMLLHIVFVAAIEFPWRLDPASVWENQNEHLMEHYRYEILRATEEIFFTWSVGFALLIPTLTVRAIRSVTKRNRSMDVLNLVGVIIFFVACESFRFNLRLAHYWPGGYRDALVPSEHVETH